MFTPLDGTNSYTQTRLILILGHHAHCESELAVSYPVDVWEDSKATVDFLGCISEWSLKAARFVHCYWLLLPPSVVFDRKEDFYLFSLLSLLREQGLRVDVYWIFLNVISPADKEQRSDRKEITMLNDLKL